MDHRRFSVYIDSIIYSLIKMSNVAPVKWAQRADSLYVTISLADVIEPDIKLTSNKLSFAGKSNGKSYTLDLEFVRFFYFIPFLIRNKKILCLV